MSDINGEMAAALLPARELRRTHWTPVLNSSIGE